MNKKKHSQEFLRKRKMLLFLPFIVIPLLSMVFYGMGGGKGVKGDQASTAGSNGYNMNLPGAKFNKQDGKMDKLSAYKKSDLDSARFKDQLRQDPYHAGSMPLSASLPSITSIKGINPVKGDANSSVLPLEPQDTAANALLKRLDHLKEALHQPEINSGTPKKVNNEVTQGLQLPTDPGTERLQELLTRIKATSSTGEPDPQLDRLNGMLDKILQIQHPGLIPAKDSTIPQDKVPVFDLRKNTGSAPVADLVGSTAGAIEQAFFNLEDAMPSDSMQGNVVRAVVEGNQTLVSGGTIALRLSEDAAINGVEVPRNNLLYGLVSLSGERMNIIVNSIRYNNNIYPVTLQVFDMDGLPGIRIPGAISREVAKESADQAVSGIGMTTLDPSIGAQAASAGIQAAKTLFSRKVKLIRVAVPAGYQVLLRNIKK